jgi:hypothetical protein
LTRLLSSFSLVFSCAQDPLRQRLSSSSLDDFEIGVTLGTGSFGRVRLVNHKVRGRAISATRMRRYRRVPAIATAAPIIARHPPKQFIEPHDISTALANLHPPPCRTGDWQSVGDQNPQEVGGHQVAAGERARLMMR